MPPPLVPSQLKLKEFKAVIFLRPQQSQGNRGEDYGELDGNIPHGEHEGEMEGELELQCQLLPETVSMY